MLKRRILVVSALLAALSSANAQQPGPTTLDFSAARALTHVRADILKVDAAETARREYVLESSRSLHGPKVTLDSMQMWGRKTVEMGPVNVPIGAALAPINPALAGMTMPLSIHYTDDLSGPRSALNLKMPIFTGGAISAKIAADQASVFESRADERARRDQIDTQLTRLYFGVQLARSIEGLRADMLAQQDSELQKARRFEATGLISRLERMSVQVSRDTAQREFVAAQTDRQVAENELARLLREPSAGALTTPLFVYEDALGSLEDWMNKARAGSPVLQSIAAKRQMADQGVTAARAAWSPQVYAFASGNLVKHYLALTEPDWVAGIGVKITLWDNQDRTASLAAARAQVSKAQAAHDETSNQLMTGIETAYLRTVQSREQYRLTVSTLELARENLRLHKRGFEEGLSTANDMSEARNKLVGAEIARRLAAYRFVVSWATLHAVAGRMDDFVVTLNNKNNTLEH